ncbi:MAG: 30S ribosomal protein S15 [Patescibacteria group bacterium]
MSKRTELSNKALTEVDGVNNPGSTASQIAILSQRIANLQEHLVSNKKDKHSRRGLLQMVSKRRKLIKYLKRTDEQAWGELASTLGLKA